MKKDLEEIKDSIEALNTLMIVVMAKLGYDLKFFKKSKGLTVDVGDKKPKKKSK